MKKLTAIKDFEVRFSEVDSMNIVWHGSYPLYFEDAREEFGRKYGLGYMTIFGNGYFAPLVELSFKYKRPLAYEMQPAVRITYIPTESAKIRIRNLRPRRQWYYSHRAFRAGIHG